MGGLDRPAGVQGGWGRGRGRGKDATLSFMARIPLDRTSENWERGVFLMRPSWVAISR